MDPLVDEMRPLINDLRPAVQDLRVRLAERLPLVASAAAQFVERLDLGTNLDRIVGAGTARLGSMRPTHERLKMMHR